ncbi:MAG: sulfonate transport system substrate-binding protein [Hyphomicrobiales bacterium]|nr:sulfonate transport system substrate-binding protein [Hyphomicrobiales bacterium]
MIWRIVGAAALAAAILVPRGASAEANVVRVAKQFGVGYMQYMVMQELKLIEKHAKAAGLDITTEWATFRSSDVMNDALISGSVDFVSLGVPGIITIYSKTKGTANEVKGVMGLNVSPLMLLVRDPAITSLKDFKDSHRIALPAVKVSNQAIILQMAAAKEFGDAKYAALDHLTVSMSHPDATAAMLGGAAEITANFSSAPFQYRQMKSPNVRRLLNSKDLFADDPMSFNVVAATSKFRNENPKLYAAFVAGMNEATAIINADKRRGAEIYLKVSGEKTTVDEIMEVLADPDIVYNNRVGGIRTFVNFMAKTGTLKNPPADWKDMFFPEAGAGAGG